MQIERMLSGYLTIRLTIEHPETKLPIVLMPLTPIKINNFTKIAWINSYQVKLNRHTYCLIN